MRGTGIPGGRCAVAICTSPKDDEISYHRFPSNPLIQRSWVHACKRLDQINVKRARVCSIHFTPDDFERDLVHELLNLPVRKILKSGAVPTLNLVPEKFDLVYRKKEKTSKKGKNAKNKKAPNDTSTASKKRAAIAAEHRETLAAKLSRQELVRDALEAYEREQKALSEQPPVPKNANASTQVNFHRTEMANMKLNLKGHKLKLHAQRTELLELRKFKRKVSTLSYKRQIIASALGDGGTQLTKPNTAKRVAKWSEPTILNAIMLRSFSLRSYCYLRRSKMLPVPAPSTLRSWLRKTHSEPGVLASVLKLLKVFVEGEISAHSKIAFLSFNVIDLPECHELDKETNLEVHGQHKKLQVGLLRGMIKSWKQPIYFDFEGTLREDIIVNAINAAEEIGIKVWAVVIDLNNEAIINAFGISPQKPFFVNPADSSRNVYVMPDPAELLKHLRNHLLDNGIQIDERCRLTKDDLRQILTSGSGEHVNNLKFNHDHLNCQGQARQGVQPAAELLSHVTAITLQTLFPEKHKQAEWINTVAAWYCIMSSRVYAEKNKLTCAFGVHREEQRAALESMFRLAEGMRSATCDILVPLQTSIMTGINALIHLFDALALQHSVTNIKTVCFIREEDERYLATRLGTPDDQQKAVTCENKVHAFVFGIRTDHKRAVIPDNPFSEFVTHKLTYPVFYKKGNLLKKAKPPQPKKQKTKKGKKSKKVGGQVKKIKKTKKSDGDSTSPSKIVAAKSVSNAPSDIGHHSTSDIGQQVYGTPLYYINGLPSTSSMNWS